MKKDIDLLKYFSKSEINELARETGFVKRKSPMDGLNFLLTFSIGAVNCENATLAQLAAFINNTNNINITPQAIDERITEKAKIFMKACLEKAMRVTVQKINIPNPLISFFFAYIYY